MFEMFVIGQVGSFIMNLNFEKYAEEKLGLKDPFKANIENFKKLIKCIQKKMEVWLLKFQINKSQTHMTKHILIII